MSEADDSPKKKVAVKIVKYDPEDDDDIENVFT